MTHRLLKYELKAVYKMLLLALAAVFVLGNLCAVVVGFTSSNWGDFGIAIGVVFVSFFWFFYFNASSAILTVITVFSCIRYVKTMWGKESYVYQTIPASSHSFVLSHFLAWLIMFFLSVAVLLSGEMLMNALSQGFIDGLGIFFINLFIDDAEATVLILAGVVMGAYLMIHALLSITIGQSFYRGKWVITILFYITTHVAAACLAILLGTTFLDRSMPLYTDAFVILYTSVLLVGYYFLTVYFAGTTRETY